MIQTISYLKLDLFSQLIKRYLSENKEVEELYSYFPKWENFSKQIALKSAQRINRDLLIHRLTAQYQGIESTEITLKQIESLRSTKTFTVTTGHQLNLFTGPLYFVYKIISTIKLCQQLQEKYPDYQFVPVYWMATEDHDFDEINHFHPVIDKTIRWNREFKGAVGRTHTVDLQSVFEEFSNLLKEDEFDTELKTLFKEAYDNGHNLSLATRILVHRLFGKYGLVVIDADDVELKKQLVLVAKEELKNQVIFQNVTITNDFLSKKGLQVQVNPRTINLFYLKDQLRERIILEDGWYQINNTNLRFTEAELLDELQNYPDRFSPNVLLRPVYQEVLLPNIAYIGGAAEIAYWLQLKAAFDRFKIPFPILVLRNSALWIPVKTEQKWKKIGLSLEDYLSDKETITKKIIVQNAESNIPDFNKLEESMVLEIQQVTNWLEKVEPTLIPAVRATLQKQLNEWNNWNQKLHKTLKKKHADQIDRASQILSQIYPEGILQERYLNFTFIYQIMGSEMFDVLIKNFEPLKFEFCYMQY